MQIRLRRRPKVPQVRPDYRAFDMSRMKHWGHSAFWWPQECVGERACIFGPLPHNGDVLVDFGTAFVVTSVETHSNPGDQHFVTVKEWGPASELAPSTRGHRWTDDLV